MASVRGYEPLRQLQGQRHDRGVYARPHGAARGGWRARVRETPRRRVRSFARPRIWDSRRSFSSAPARSRTASWRRPGSRGGSRFRSQAISTTPCCAFRQVADRLGIYLMNSINPFRLEGQKAIMYRVLEGLNWETPDWVVVPGGNLGNASAFGKAFLELKHLGLIERIPRLAVINAHGAHARATCRRPRPLLERGLA